MSEEFDTLVSSARCAQMLDVSPSTLSCIKRAMGIRRHKVVPAEVAKFLRDNPSFVPGRVDEWLEQRRKDEQPVSQAA